jgi:hypothetical protein
MAHEQEQRIRNFAYLLWLDEGKPEGKDKEHWERARVAIELFDQHNAEFVKREVQASSVSSDGPAVSTNKPT